jgi:putative FmdB family regulatory protein
MPTYEYRCGSCGATFESRRTIADADAPITCPEGHADGKRALSVFAVGKATVARQPLRPAASGCGPGCACAATP